MKRWMPVLLLAAAAGFLVSGAITAPGDVHCNTATATAQTPDHVIGVDGSPVSTVPGATDTAIATACITEPDPVTVTVTTTGPPPPPPPPPPPATITIGETTLLGTVDNGNGNLLMAQSATLGQQATLASLSFNVVTAAGNLRLGVYTDVGGRPGSLLAQTASFAASAGWDTQPVTPSPVLDPGTYWLAYLPSSSALSFRKGTDSSSSGLFMPFAFGPLPATFSPSPTPSAGNAHRSFYATLTPTGAPPPPPPPPGPTTYSGTFDCYGSTPNCKGL